MIRNRLNLKDTSEVECLKEYYEIIMRKYEIVNKEKDKKFEEMKKFTLWYKESNKECYYCGISKENLKKLFDNKVIQSKKPSFNGTLQIKRLNPNKGYVEDNCVLACCICNNAKSDMINAKNFKEYFAESVKKFYNDLLNGKTNSFL